MLHLVRAEVQAVEAVLMMMHQCLDAKVQAVEPVQALQHSFEEDVQQ